VLFLDLNGFAWLPDRPDVDAAEQAMLAVAARQHPAVIGAVNGAWRHGATRTPGRTSS
jgi:hypothetical protein